MRRVALIVPELSIAAIGGEPHFVRAALDQDEAGAIFRACGIHGQDRSLSRTPLSWPQPSFRPASKANPKDIPGPRSTSISTMIRRPSQSWDMKLPSTAHELIASIPAVENSSSVILPINKAPGEYLAY
jgi:hypothetical protein